MTLCRPGTWENAAAREIVRRWAEICDAGADAGLLANDLTADDYERTRLVEEVIRRFAENGE